jgi:hypothetical protein
MYEPTFIFLVYIELPVPMRLFSIFTPLFRFQGARTRRSLTSGRPPVVFCASFLHGDHPLSPSHEGGVVTQKCNE